MHWLPLFVAFTHALGADQAGAPTVQGQPGVGDGAPPPVQLEDVEVLARRGSASVTPETELGAADIDALGAYDIGDVINRTTAALGSREPPIVIVNGRRMANPNIFYGFPPDALVRVEVLPGGAAPLYGGDPSRRVVNIVLQQNFKSQDGLLNAGRPSSGGRSSLLGDLRRSTISGNDTNQYGVRVSRETSLRAGERHLSSMAGVESGRATLRPQSDAVAANLMLTRTLGDWNGTFGVDARSQTDHSVLIVDAEAVDSRQRTGDLIITNGLNGNIGEWSVQLGLNGQLADAKRTGPNSSETSTQSIAATIAGNRTLLDLPAGPITANFSGQLSRARTVLDTTERHMTFSTYAGDVGGNISVPLSRSSPSPEVGGGGGGWLGDAFVTIGANFRQTDVGQGESFNTTWSWSPLQKLKFNGALSTSTDSVSDQQRFDPIFFGPPQTVYDFQTGQSVEISPILGGNPELRPPRTDQVSVAASVGPFTSWNLFGGVNLQTMTAADGIGALPLLTPAIEAAFPERFTRDGEGRLISIDQRPINILSARTSTLSSNLNFAVPMGGSASGALSRPSTWRVALNHVWQLQNTNVIRQGLPELDRLIGDGGGLSPHEFSLLIDGRRGQWVFNATTRWRSPYRIRRDIGQDGPADLCIDSFGTIDIKLSYQFEGTLPSQANGSQPRRGVGLQLGLEVENLLDARPAANLGDGNPAPGYGPDDQDPIGRSIRLTVTRRF